MKPKMILKLTVDIGMTAALPKVTTYEPVAPPSHEWIANFRWSGRQPMNGSALECLSFLSSTIS